MSERGGNLFAIPLRTSVWIVSETQTIITKMGWGALILIALVTLIWSIFKKPLSRLRKVKNAYVQILHVQNYGLAEYKGDEKSRLGRSLSFSTATVAVRFLAPSRPWRKIIYMDLDGMSEGVKGNLQYQGVLGISFQPEPQEEKGSIYQKYNFEKKKKEEQKVKVDNRTHHKRKYW